MPFELRKGTRDSTSVPVASAAVIAVGDVIQYDEAGDVIDGVAGAEVYAIAQEASASGATANILAEIIFPGNVYRVVPSSGTVGTTLQRGDTCDITSGGAAVDLTATAQNDVILEGDEGTTAVLVMFKNTVTGA